MNNLQKNTEECYLITISTRVVLEPTVIPEGMTLSLLQAVL